MAPERLIHKKWPPQQPDGRQRIPRGCVSGPEKHDAVTEAAVAVRECSPRAPLAALRFPRADTHPERPERDNVDPRSYPTQKLERTPRIPPLLDSRVEKQGCSAPSSGSPGGSGLP